MILTRVLAQLVGEPLTVLFDTVGRGLRSILSQHNLLLQFGLLFAVAAVFVLSLKICLYSKVFGRVFRSESHLPHYKTYSYINDSTHTLQESNQGIKRLC